MKKLNLILIAASIGVFVYGCGNSDTKEQTKAPEETVQMKDQDHEETEEVNPIEFINSVKRAKQAINFKLYNERQKS